MSVARMRWLLWLVLVLLLPLPYFAIQAGRIPAVQLAMYAALVVPLNLRDFGLTPAVLGALFAVQTLAYGALLLWLSGFLARRVPPPRRAAALAGIAVALLLLAALPVYVAPLTAGPYPTHWLGLWP
ncbi:hypothetical protein KF840_03810 [bacterium]|nr:hypothetical protein [bacterium]